MGEYVKYKDQEIKIGTLESLFYVTYDKYKAALEAGQLRQSLGGEPPENYLRPDTDNRFRFPFPDEDKLELGDIGSFPYDRALPVKIRAEIDSDLKGVLSEHYIELEIRQQRLVHRQEDNRLILAVVVNDPVHDRKFRIEDDNAIRKLCREIIHNHVNTEKELETKRFYQQVAQRMAEGYGISIKDLLKQKPAIRKPLKNKRGKGL